MHECKLRHAFLEGLHYERLCRAFTAHAVVLTRDQEGFGEAPPAGGEREILSAIDDGHEQPVTRRTAGCCAEKGPEAQQKHGQHANKLQTL